LIRAATHLTYSATNADREPLAVLRQHQIDLTD
jgi:hypothetical protein